jgi:hypothetical protein
VDLAAGDDRVVVKGGGGVDTITAGAAGVNLNNDDDVDVTLMKNEELTLEGAPATTPSRPTEGRAPARLLGPP